MEEEERRVQAARRDFFSSIVASLSLSRSPDEDVFRRWQLKDANIREEEEATSSPLK